MKLNIPIKLAPFQAALLVSALLASTPVIAEPPLPWEEDYAGALAKAKAEKRPLFLMLTATWCGPCKMLESQTLPSPAVLSGLKEFVWVKAYEDAALNKQFNMGGYPTLLFLDSSSGRVLEQTTGYERPESFMRHVLAARRAVNLPLTKDMEELLAKALVPDPTPVMAEPPLPWEKDYTSALAKAKAEKRPLLLMLTATWCGPCKMLESQTLPSPAVLSGLKEFVWVKAYEDAALNKQFNMGGYPTLLFLDSSSGRVLEQTVGYERAESFMRHVLTARRAANLPSTKDMDELLAKAFVPDENKVTTFIDGGDADGLVKYLSPARDDLLRFCNFFVAKLRLPSGVKPSDVVTITGESDYPMPSSGVLFIPVPRDGTTIPLQIIAPRCKSIEDSIGVDEKAGVDGREFDLEPVSAKDAASFTGRVLGPDGQPVSKAIVRICDWDVTHADSQGRFQFAGLSPGTFLVRGEAPGGEFHKELTFIGGQELKKDLPLKAVTTVGIRWALQTKEGSRELTGDGVQTGEAYFSVDHSRFLLSRGAQTRFYHGSDFMLRADWKGVRKFLTKEQVAALEASNTGAPIFWLFDTAHGNGLHAENVPFEDIRAVNDGKPYDEKTFFQMLRGEEVRKEQVFTVRRCLVKDYYAKMEITDVTVPPK